MRLVLPALSSLLSVAYGQQVRPVEILAPANESVFRTGSDITLIARCSTDSPSVRFFADGASVGEAPCGDAFLWKGATSGIHAISASAGVESEPVLVFVNDSASRPRMESVRGVVRAAVEDRFDERTSHTYYSISTNGASIPIAFPSIAVHAAARSGKPVTLEGFRDSGRFYPRPAVTREPDAASAPLAAFGVRRVAVILVNYLNQTSQPFTAQAASLLSTVNQFYQEASYQQYSISADVYGYFNLPINETCIGGSEVGSSFAAITNAGMQAAKNAGIDLSPYQGYIFIGPTATQCGGGIATIGGAGACSYSLQFIR